jgi:hypothetical protein
MPPASREAVKTDTAIAVDISAHRSEGAAAGSAIGLAVPSAGDARNHGKPRRTPTLLEQTADLTASIDLPLTRRQDGG